MLIASPKCAIIVREASFLKTLSFFLNEKFSKKIQLASYGLNSIPRIHMFSYNASSEEIISWVVKEQFEKAIFLSNQSGLRQDAQIASELNKKGIKTYAQSIYASEIGSDKVMMKQFFSEHNFPTSPYKILTNLEEAIAATKELSFPLILKATNLSDGRKMAVAQSISDIESYFYEHAVDYTVIIEEYIEGREASVIVYPNYGNPFIFPPVAKPLTKYLLDSREKMRQRLYVISDDFFSKELKNKIKEIALRFSKEIDNKFLLGIDMVIRNNDIYILECNARIVETLRMSMISTDINIIESMITGESISTESQIVKPKGITLDIPVELLSSTDFQKLLPKGELKEVITESRITRSFPAQEVPKSLLNTYL